MALLRGSLVALIAVLIVGGGAGLLLFSGEGAGYLPKWLSAWQQEDVSSGPRIVLQMEPGGGDARQAIAEAVNVIERRLNDLGIRASVRADGADRIVIQVQQSGNASRVIEVATRPGKLEFRLVDLSMSAERATQGQPPASAEILYDAEKRPFLIEKRVPLTGREVVDAQPSFDQRTSEPVVSFRFSPNGTRRFALLTQENVGRPFAIVLDNVVLSAPVIREPIVGGSGQISGNLTVQQAYDMALLLRSGALPARFKVIEEGADSR